SRSHDPRAQHSFPTRRSSDLGRSTEDGIQTFNQTFSNPAQQSDRRINDGYEDGKNVNIQLDYTLPFSENHRLEAGYRTSIRMDRSEEHTSELQSRENLVCRLL